jgi:hypothetical protein
MHRRPRRRQLQRNDIHSKRYAKDFVAMDVIVLLRFNGGIRKSSVALKWSELDKGMYTYLLACGAAFLRLLWRW